MLRTKAPKKSMKTAAHAKKSAKKIAKPAHAAHAKKPHQQQTRNMAVAVSAAMVKKLRDATGAPMIECKKALTNMLEQPDFDVDNNELVMKGAAEYLRKRGAALATKNAGRTAMEGLVVYAVNKQKTKAALIELNCETDFVARNTTFMNYAARVAMTMLEQTPKTTTVDPRFKGLLLDATEYQDAALAEGPSAMASNPNASTNNVATELLDVITNCRENIKLRRIGIVEVPAGKKGFVASYVHNEIPHTDEFKPFFDQVNEEKGIAMRLGNSAAIGAFTIDDAAELDAEAVDLGRKIMMQAVASSPEYLSRDAVPADVVAKEKEIMLAQTPVDGKPQHIVEKLMEGKMNKFYGGACLLDQEFALTNDSKPPTITQLLERQPSKPQAVAVVKFLRGEVLPGEEFKEEM